MSVLKEGIKHDKGKPPYGLISPIFLEAVAVVLGFGADKYEPYNWAKGMSWHKVFSAIMRHLWAWWRGEKFDKESGLSHLWHAACGLMFLVDYEHNSIGTDDRRVLSNSFPPTESVIRPAEKSSAVEQLSFTFKEELDANHISSTTADTYRNDNTVVPDWVSSLQKNIF